MQSIRDCNQVEVLKYYIESELGNLFQIHTRSQDFALTLHGLAAALDDKSTRKWFDFLAGPLFRKNPLHHYVSNWTVKWSLSRLDGGEIEISKINREIDSEVDDNIGSRRLNNVAEYIRSGRASERFRREFANDDRKIVHARIIAIMRDENCQIVDGSHRAVVLALRSVTEFETYLGMLSSKIP